MTVVVEWDLGADVIRQDGVLWVVKVVHVEQIEREREDQDDDE